MVRFGDAAAVAPGAALTVDVHLPVLGTDRAANPCVERWLARGPVVSGASDGVRYVHDDRLLFAVIEQDESEAGGVEAAAERVYAKLRAFEQTTPFRHTLRIWNYMDAINEGAGDGERYRRFCVGRARGLGDALSQPYPAATGVGRQQATGRLQVFWISGRTPGLGIENPRQVSAWRYPREYSPVSPGFARATLTDDGALLVSGTASIVGHASRHIGDALAQLEETLRNLHTLAAQTRNAERPTRSSLLKVYVRDPASLDAVRARVRLAWPDAPALYLAADVCRRELLVEIEALWLA